MTHRTAHRIAWVFIIAVFALVLAQRAGAAGGQYTINGGTPAEQAVVANALNADPFPWALAGNVTITITSDPEATHNSSAWSTRGNIAFQAGWLDISDYTLVQHEMSHQVDYNSLTDAQRAQLLAFLGGTTWWNPGDGSVPHDDQGAERFAEEMAATYGVQDSHGDSVLWKPALSFDTELVTLGLIPAPLLHHPTLVCHTVRHVIRTHHHRHVVTRRVCRMQ